MRKLLGDLLECRGEISVRSTIIKAARGYEKPAFSDIITDFFLSYIIVYPDHLAKCHSFAALSRLKSFRYDLIEDKYDTDSGADTTNFDGTAYFVITDGTAEGMGYFGAK